MTDAIESLPGSVTVEPGRGGLDRVVVATPAAVEGMHLRDGEDVLVADDAEGFAAAVVRVPRDAALWATLAANGRANVARHFSADAARGAVRELFPTPAARA